MKTEAGRLNARRAERRSVPVRARATGARALLLSVSLGAGAALMNDAGAQDSPLPGTTAADGDARAVDLSPSRALDASERVMAPQERVTRGKAFAAAIERSAQSIQRQLQVARKERDVVRVLCLNDKLNQVDVALRSARDRLDALRSAAERGDEDRLRHEYTVLEVLNDRVRVLVNESNQCVGEETGFIGEAEVSVSVDPNLPEVDTDTDPGFGSVPPLPNISSPIE